MDELLNFCGEADIGEIYMNVYTNKNNVFTKEDKKYFEGLAKYIQGNQVKTKFENQG